VVCVSVILPYTLHAVDAASSERHSMPDCSKIFLIQIPFHEGSRTHRHAMISFDRPDTPENQPASPAKKMDRNVLGGPLVPCSKDPLTGFFRDGCCRSGSDDVGVHTICAVMTKEFLIFTVSVGNDLVTPHPEWNFPGLVAGDRWCLCAARWLEAAQAGSAPEVVLEATHEKSLAIVPLKMLRHHAFKQP